MFERLKSAKQKGMGAVDRILTIIVTATITSMVWIVAGGSLIELSSADSQIEKTRPADAAAEADSRLTRETVAGETGAEDEGEASTVERRRNIASLDRANATPPRETQLGQMVIPVLNVRPDDLSDSFLAARDGGDRLHEAIDIMAPAGTSVIACSHPA